MTEHADIDALAELMQDAELQPAVPLLKRRRSKKVEGRTNVTHYLSHAMHDKVRGCSYAHDIAIQKIYDKGLELAFAHFGLGKFIPWDGAAAEKERK